MNRVALILSLLGVAAAPLVATDAFGHGLGADQAPPINFAGMDVTVRTALTPSDITVGEIDDANVNVKFFDVDTNKTFNDVTYRIDIIRSGDLLARELFYDDEGSLDVEVRPILSCNEVLLWKCSKYSGERHPIAAGLFARGDGRPIIEGPIFDKGGLYNILVTIEGATSPKSLVAEPLSFETFVSVAQKQDFIIQTAHAEEVPVVVKTYYDDILSLDYSATDHAITFDMPFDWDPGYVSLVQLVHEEIQIPKSFEPYNVTDFKGYVNGIEVRNRQLAFDPYSRSDAGSNIIHFVVTGDELKRVNDLLGPSNHDNDRMTFELVPQAGIVRNSEEFYLVDPQTGGKAGSTVNISWDAKYGAGEDIPFKFIFYDESRNRLNDVKYAYYVYDEGDDNRIIASGGDDLDDLGNLGIETFEGIGVQNIVIPSQKTHRIDVWILGQGVDLNPAYAGVGSVRVQVGQAVDDAVTTPPGGQDVPPPPPPPPPPQQQQITIPGWVKSNAGLWSDGSIDDGTFASGIQYMIKEGIITVPKTDPAAGAQSEIPPWVRNNAGIWSDGLIDDQTFANGLQWLIANGVITVSERGEE